MKDLRTQRQEFIQVMNNTTKSFMVHKDPNGIAKVSINTHLTGSLGWSVGILSSSDVALTRLELMELRDAINEFLDNN